MLPSLLVLSHQSSTDMSAAAGFRVVVVERGSQQDGPLCEHCTATHRNARNAAGPRDQSMFFDQASLSGVSLVGSRSAAAAANHSCQGKARTAARPRLALESPPGLSTPSRSARILFSSVAHKMQTGFHVLVRVAEAALMSGFSSEPQRCTRSRTERSACAVPLLRVTPLLQMECSFQLFLFFFFNWGCRGSAVKVASLPWW